LASSTILAPGARHQPGACAASVTRGRKLGFHALVGGSQLGLGLVGGRQALGDLLARASSAAVIGGQMYFIVNPTRIRNTII
jgi:hypothetical protein